MAEEDMPFWCSIFPQSFKLESSLNSRYKDVLLYIRYIKHIVYKLYQLKTPMFPQIITVEKVGQQRGQYGTGRPEKSDNSFANSSYLPI